MPEAEERRSEPETGIRLETMIRIRWIAVAGQTAALLFVAYGLGYAFRLSLCLALVAASAWLNVFLRLRYRASFRLSENATVALLAYDILQLAALLYLTGGLQNPFSALLVVPVIVSASTLPVRRILPLGAFTVAAASLLAFWHLPLPWPAGETPSLPLVYVAGIWVAIVAMLGFAAVFAFQVAEEARKLSNALAATELALQREQHLSALDGLAAAAAHELGTPLATIALVAGEMHRIRGSDAEIAGDIELLRGQAERCRTILSRLKSLSGVDHLGRMPLSSLMEEVAAPHREFGVEVSISPGPQSGEPVCPRNPGILYGLGNLIENAVDFAESRVSIAARWGEREIEVEISDDGPGYPRELIERIGDPYMSMRRARNESTGGGLGLGLFIAKTLLERSGASLEFANARPGDSLPGARVRVRWPRAVLEIGPEQETNAGAVVPATF
jgi:two-component system sensor histidine kinase RegB